MPRFIRPDPIVGGPAADNDTRETARERFDGIQRNFDAFELFINQLASRFYWGSGTPEAAVTAPVGSIYFRLDGGASTTLYVKESGTGNTGWIAK